MIRHNRGAILLLTLTVLAPAPSLAQEIKPFVPGSIAQIYSAHAGRPFILGLWSLTCVYCKDDLQVLGKLIQRHPDLAVVLVSTDTPAEKAVLARTLKQYGLHQAQAWVFADDFVERLRFEIDRNWYGELPRTYFITATGQSQAVSGRLSPAGVQQWLRDNSRRHR